MILGNMDRDANANRATLDDLFRRAGVRRSGDLALVDQARRLTYAEADRAIANVGSRLLQLGLAADTVVGLQLANTVESVIALLGVLRAGMIAAPLPLLWRKHDMLVGLSRVGAKAIVTHAPAADAAMQAAAELFAVRYVCAFGNDMPDGVIGLHDVFDTGTADVVHPPARAGNAADHVAVVTLDVTAGGMVPVARNHAELIAGGLAVLLEGGIAEDATILSVVPLGSFAGLALILMPWLISGGTLVLHQDFDAGAFAGQCRSHEPDTLVLPSAALAPLADAGLIGTATKNILTVWRAPERLAAAVPWRGEASLTDVACFGELGLLPARRGGDGLPVPIPLGIITAPRCAAGAIPVAEATRSKSGMLTLRGPMVPLQTFPPGAEPSVPDAFADTGFACRLESETNTLTITASPAGLTTIGGYRFRQNDVDWLVAEADLDATIVALPDALLCQRFAGSAPDLAMTRAELQARSANPLVAGAFRPRQQDNAA